ncbi:peptidase M15D, vanX Dala-D-ala dipeptidase [Acanthamoeba castellanii str. Neff]|uniref:Peptidase M15D, vanX Dala-D-ala dipeptidase n=1 Tax=Acanthamoeba castellanii (strain ATCC 30010 / Neff) TaxID=1257118 RepID=L8GHK1_ACACF|nr:peptidase M15D, vanX Dala-D-ala dipeptidase [Acanthamoeba castellanii str. Neff]ELR12334.1 peptidase M15D, vanX Dala-D-ala dipeptidase [Acanthamoeba castellanii str. Neff]
MDSQPPSACVTDTGDQTRVELVDLRTLSPSLRFDIRYATTNNFMGAAFYTTPGAFLQRPAAEALVRVHDKLQELGYGLLVHDAYRPWHVTKMFWDATPPEKRIYVADPDKGSEHNRGCAVDLTLYSRATGDVAEMIGGYDEFSQRSHVNYPGGTSLQRWLRKLLRDAMESEGFAVYEYEWWHFDYRDVLRYPVLNFSLEDLT